MKKNIIILGILLVCIILYYTGEQIYLYIKHDKENLGFIISNQNTPTDVNIAVKIDDKFIYDTCVMHHPGYIYGKRIHLPMGRHHIEVFRDSTLLYEHDFSIFFNKEFVIDYFEDDRISVLRSSRPMMIQ